MVRPRCLPSMRYRADGAMRNGNCSHAAFLELFAHKCTQLSMPSPPRFGLKIHICTVPTLRLTFVYFNWGAPPHYYLPHHFCLSNNPNKIIKSLLQIPMVALYLCYSNSYESYPLVKFSILDRHSFFDECKCINWTAWPVIFLDPRPCTKLPRYKILSSSVCPFIRLRERGQ